MARGGSSDGTSAAETKLNRLCGRIARSLMPRRSDHPIICCATRGHEPAAQTSRREIHQRVSDGHEFVFPSGGSMQVNTPEGLKRLSPGQVLLVGRGVPKEESPVDAGRSVTMNWCYTHHSLALLGQTAYTPRGGWCSSTKLELVGQTDVESIAAVVLQELTRRNLGWTETSSSLLNYLSWILVRRIKRGALRQLSPTESPTISTDPDGWRTVRATLEYCDQNFRRPFGLDEVAHAVGYSASYLSRLFSRHVGRSLFRHVRDLRITEAKRLLESTAMKMSEISYALGYGDPTQFSRAFKQETGVSPREYRETVSIE
jgi:AraC-like DNA-binding protein